ncbi:MAG TPA: glycosyltransferase family 1 protein [Puia sp.]|nr:glycosyltransferase family 1 protein [Puia sp.]
MLKKRIVYIFRKPDRFYSIEHVFGLIAKEIESGGEMEVTRVSLPQAGLNRSSFFGNRQFIRQLEADLFHVTGDVHYVSLFLPAKKTMLTIHDCNFMYNARGIKKWLLHKLLLRWPIGRSRWITTISEATKRDIIRFTGCLPEKIRVIPNPVSNRIAYQPKIFNKQKPDILFFGTTMNKNLNRVGPALAGISCVLHIIGKIDLPERRMLEGHQIEYRNYLDLSEDDMISTYASTDFLLFPSTFEGFGMPIIEAQKTGRAVVTSNLSPMKEVAGAGAILVDPENIDSIREGVLRVIGDESTREDIIAKGLENVRQFDVKKIAGQYLALYKEMSPQ